MITIPLNGKANTNDLIKEVNDNGYLTYLVGEISFNDISENNTMEMWNESLTDSIIENGYLLQNMDYELKCIDGKVFIQVTTFASEWLDSVHEI
jgi:hypothetical protein